MSSTGFTLTSTTCYKGGCLLQEAYLHLAMTTSLFNDKHRCHSAVICVIAFMAATEWLQQEDEEQSAHLMVKFPPSTAESCVKLPPYTTPHVKLFGSSACKHHHQTFKHAYHVKICALTQVEKVTQAFV